MNVVFPPIKLSFSTAIRYGKVILKQLCSSYSAASLSQGTGESWTGSIRGVVDGGSHSAVPPSAICAVSWALALWTCWSWRSLLHIYTNFVYILKLSFNLFMYFSSKRSKCFLPLAAVLGRSVLFSLTPLQKRRPSGNHLAAWSKAGICCIKEYVMVLCSFSHMQTPLFFACAQCQSWLSQGVQCSLKHWAVKTWALIVLIVCSCMKHSAGARSPWNFQGLQLPLNFWLWFEFNVLGM